MHSRDRCFEPALNGPVRKRTLMHLTVQAEATLAAGHSIHGVCIRPARHGASHWILISKRFSLSPDLMRVPASSFCASRARWTVHGASACGHRHLGAYRSLVLHSLPAQCRLDSQRNRVCHARLPICHLDRVFPPRLLVGIASLQKLFTLPC